MTLFCFSDNPHTKILGVHRSPLHCMV